MLECVMLFYQETIMSIIITANLILRLLLHLFVSVLEYEHLHKTGVIGV